MDPETPEPLDAELEPSRAPFLDHLEELRSRLWRSLIAVVAAGILCAFFYQDIYGLLTRPLFEILEAKKLPNRMVFRTLPGPFLFQFKTAILGGIFLGLPIVLYQFWQFVAPGLYKHERKLAFPFVLMSTVCFAGGAAFAYNLVLPQAFDFLLGYAIQSGPQKLTPDITLEDYLGFTMKVLLAFGVVFELPVAVAFLSGVGMVTHRTLITFWRWAIVMAFVLAAILTPPDYVTQVMLAGPLCILYGLSIGIAWFITEQRAKRTPPEEPDPEDEPPEGEDPPAGGHPPLESPSGAAEPDSADSGDTAPQRDLGGEAPPEAAGAEMAPPEPPAQPEPPPPAPATPESGAPAREAPSDATPSSSRDDGGEPPVQPKPSAGQGPDEP